MPARPSVTKLSPARRAAWRCSSTRGEITGSAHARMDRAALSASAQRLARIKPLEQRREVLHDALQLHLHAVQEMVAFLAIPFEAVLHALRPGALDDQAEAARFGPLRRMTQVRRHEED